MRELPILFSGPLVRSILAGRKTVTRRPVTVPWKGSRRALPYEPYYVEEDGRLLFCDEYGDYHPMEPLCPFGVVGDKLWVRETWSEDGVQRVPPYPRAWYRAGFDFRLANHNALDGGMHGYGLCLGCSVATFRWRPSIHMPRWASRITLEVTGVRVERLQDITEDEAADEGVEPLASVAPGQPIIGDVRRRDFGVFPHVGAFAVTWDSIYAAKPGLSWAANPWVWAVAFRVAEVRR